MLHTPKLIARQILTIFYIFITTGKCAIKFHTHRHFCSVLFFYNSKLMRLLQIKQSRFSVLKYLYNKNRNMLFPMSFPHDARIVNDILLHTNSEFLYTRKNLSHGKVTKKRKHCKLKYC